MTSSEGVKGTWRPDVGEYISTFRPGSRVSLLSDSADKPAQKTTHTGPRTEGRLVTGAANALKYDMTWLEFREFHDDERSVNELCGRLEPIILYYEWNKRPRDVSKKLNEDGYRTARVA